MDSLLFFDLVCYVSIIDQKMDIRTFITVIVTETKKILELVNETTD